jgi:hypothetical protein
MGQSTRKRERAPPTRRIKGDGVLADESIGAFETHGTDFTGGESQRSRSDLGAGRSPLMGRRVHDTRDLSWLTIPTVYALRLKQFSTFLPQPYNSTVTTWCL